jgi:hypothetical protein
METEAASPVPQELPTDPVLRQTNRVIVTETHDHNLPAAKMSICRTSTDIFKISSENYVKLHNNQLRNSI